MSVCIDKIDIYAARHRQRTQYAVHPNLILDESLRIAVVESLRPPEPDFAASIVLHEVQVRGRGRRRKIVTGLGGRYDRIAGTAIQRSVLDGAHAERVGGGACQVTNDHRLTAGRRPDPVDVFGNSAAIHVDPVDTTMGRTVVWRFSPGELYMRWRKHSGLQGWRPGRRRIGRCADVHKVALSRFIAIIVYGMDGKSIWRTWR